MLRSFEPDMQAIVVGASGGIGGALAAKLRQLPQVTSLITTSRRGDGADVAMDITDEASIKAIAGMVQQPRLIIIASGLLHSDALQPEKSWRSLTAEQMARSYAVNVIGPALVAKHFLPLMPRTGKIIFAPLSARVGSITDNHTGGWHSYRASKAALNQLVRTLAHELTLKNPAAVCAGLHPGTVATQMSAPFRQHVVAGKIFSPEQAADYLLKVIDGLNAADSGGCFAWDGSRIPA